MNFLILGGTGTLGNELTRQILSVNSEHRVTCFSRCELKQYHMKRKFNDSRISYVLGDIRDRDALARVMPGMDVVFHVAALKHVDKMEENPFECKKTNADATENVAFAAIGACVPFVIFSSTDKAVDPINSYGLCKALSEKMLFHLNATQKKTKFAVYRWGNVLGSNGSVLEAFESSLLNSQSVHITDMDMTRFWINIEDAVDYMLKSFPIADPAAPMIPDIKAASVERVVSRLANMMGVPSYSVKVFGIRPGEKIHESLQSQWNCKPLASDSAEQYSDEEIDGLLIKARGRK